MRVGVIGINHKLADLGLRESFAKICQRWFCTTNPIHGEHTLVLLTTCNRTEVYFCSSDLTYTHSYILRVLSQNLSTLEDGFDQKLYSYFGHDCFKHLVRVTAGLDSAIVAETEIQNQVKVAYESAKEYFTLPSDMHYLFQKALKIGKQIRTELPLGPGVPDLEHAILSVGSTTFANPEQAQILFVGSSDINRKVITFLIGKKFENITICNRTQESAHALAQKYCIKTIEWLKISEWHQFDWIIFGTKSSEYLISRHDTRHRNLSHKLIIDLSVPRNVEPKLCSDPRITLLNIDQINLSLRTRKQQISHLLAQAENLVQSATHKHMALLRDKTSKKQQICSFNESISCSYSWI